MMTSDIAFVRSKLQAPSSIVVITHRNPDGDAIGSSLALQGLLRRFGHTVHVVFPSEYPHIFGFMPNIDEALVFDNQQEETIRRINDCDLLFCLDFNGLDRIDTLGPIVNKAKVTKFVIDHHLDPEPFADWYLSDTGASSTCELVFRFIDLIDGRRKMDLDIATALFVGLITDTGSFTYNTNPATYETAAELKKMGVDDYELNDLIYNSWSERQMNILGHALHNRLTVYPELTTGVIFLTKSDYKKYRISRGDTEGLVNYILMIHGMKVAAFIREMPTGDIKLSLRSKGDISVQELARDHFAGGGHKNASGGSSKKSLQETIDTFIDVLPNYL